MKKDPIIIARYVHIYDNFRNEDFFKEEEKCEYIEYPPSNRGCIYFHICRNCHLRFDTEKEEQLCPRCKGPSENIGFETREFEDNTFRGKLRKMIMDLLP